jgi:hypothetical protein
LSQQTTPDRNGSPRFIDVQQVANARRERILPVRLMMDTGELLAQHHEVLRGGTDGGQGGGFVVDPRDDDDIGRSASSRVARTKAATAVLGNQALDRAANDFALQPPAQPILLNLQVVARL